MNEPDIPPFSARIRCGIVRFTGWIVTNPAAALLLLSIASTLVYFFAVRNIYSGLPMVQWAWLRYQPRYNFEHGKIVPLIFLGLLWYKRKKLQSAPIEGSNWGVLFILIGALFFVLGARTLQARIGMFSIPFLLYGSVYLVWGKQIARILFFPCGFLIFMIPVAALEQATFQLQFLITGIASAVCNLIGIKLYAVGTTLRAVNESFGFEIAEGCSGIHSLMAMMMLTAVYVHITQDSLWKKVLIFTMSTVFAIIGNAGRIVTILLFARYISPELAGGIYHDYSAFIFFPIAMSAMMLFARLLSLNPKKYLTPPSDKDPGGSPKISYDY